MGLGSLLPRVRSPLVPIVCFRRSTGRATLRSAPFRSKIHAPTVGDFIRRRDLIVFAVGFVLAVLYLAGIYNGSNKCF
jgi:hypothetical protein